MRDNPFDVLEVDPCADTQTITRQLRKRAERADEEKRTEIQDAWQKLTLKDSDRLRYALLAHPRPPEADPQSIDVLKLKLPPAGKKLTPVDVFATVADTLPRVSSTIDILDFQPSPVFEDPL